MSIAEYTLTAQARTPEVKPAHLRRDGIAPVVLYGNSLQPLPLAIVAAELEKVFHRAGASSLVALKLPDGSEQVILFREIQRDPRTHAITHADMYAVNLTEKTRAEVPLVFIGEAPALSTNEATLVTNKDTVEVEALPKDLPHNIEVDLSGLLNVDDAIHVRDLKLAAGIEVLDAEDDTIVLVAALREEVEEAPVSEAEAVAAVEAAKEKTDTDDNASAEK